MPGPARDLQIRLYRDSLTTPWGFRLHGGKDLKAPLTVQKVHCFLKVIVIGNTPLTISIVHRDGLIDDFGRVNETV